MNNILTIERRNKLKEMLLTSGSINSGEASAMFSVTPETIRKDLIFLEKQGFAKKSYGGAIAATRYIETPFEERSDENVAEKELIAEKAYTLIPETGVILLDAGSTALLLAKLLASREGLTIITNSISVCNALMSSQNQVYITGGQAKNTTRSLVGLWASNCLETISIDIAFLGTNGFHNFSGPTAESFQEAELKKKIISRCRQTIVLADSTKFSQNALAQYALWSEIDYLITNRFADPEHLHQIRQNTNILLTDS